MQLPYQNNVHLRPLLLKVSTLLIHLLEGYFYIFDFNHLVQSYEWITSIFHKVLEQIDSGNERKSNKIIIKGFMVTPFIFQIRELKTHFPFYVPSPVLFRSVFVQSAIYHGLRAVRVLCWKKCKKEGLATRATNTRHCWRIVYSEMLCCFKKRLNLITFPS